MKAEIKRSNRKTVSVEVTFDGRVVVRAPIKMTDEAVMLFLKSKSLWIKKHLAEISLRNNSQEPVEPYSADEISTLLEEAARWIPTTVRRFASEMNVQYGKITVRTQKTRWGSCSSKKNLSFNCLLMLLTNDIREYVIIHELCHLKEMNHSASFWTEVEKYCPLYKDLKAQLKNVGAGVISRLRATEK